MDEGLTLVLLSVAMLIGCYFVGSIPLAFTFSEEKLKLVTMCGAGLLVGTALAVIIPEGVHAMYEQHHRVSPHAALPLESKSLPGVVQPSLNKDVHADHDHDHEHEHSDIHSMIGVALVLGFVFMMLVDQIGGGHSHSPDTEGQTIQHRHKITATIGLVVHAAGVGVHDLSVLTDELLPSTADGVALGAAATTSQLQLTMIVFFAIMLHKTPAAFGLVSFLLHEGFDRSRIRRHLLAFALAAPLLSIITYIGLSQQSKEALSQVNATGLALLFSAGTFLYVATVHVLPEISHKTTTTTANGATIVREHQGFTKTELALLVGGSLLPLVLSLGHHH